MIDAGNGEQYAAFKDVNLGISYTRQIKASIYYSFFSPDSTGAMTNAAGRLNPDIPILYVKASQDPYALPKTFLYDRLPENPLSRFAVVSSDHSGTPVAAVADILS